MSHNRKSWVVALTIIFTMLFSLSGSIFGSASAAALPPQQFDRCGTAMDQYFIPENDGSSFYAVNGVYAYPGMYEVQGPVVTIVASGMTDETWTFTYTDIPCSTPQAADSTVVVMGACNPDTAMTTAVLRYTNVADSTGYPRRSLAATFTRSDYFVFSQPVADVADGQFVDIRAGYFPEKGWNEGLMPGTWSVEIKSGVVSVGSAKIAVAACGFDEPPKGDPLVSQVSHSTKKPTGKLRQVPGTTKMKVVMNNKGVAGATKFSVLINRPGPGRVVKTVLVRENAVKSRTYRVPAGTLFVLKAAMKIQLADGQVTSKLKLIKRSRIRTLRR